LVVRDVDEIPARERSTSVTARLECSIYLVMDYFCPGIGSQSRPSRAAQEITQRNDQIRWPHGRFKWRQGPADLAPRVVRLNCRSHALVKNVGVH
jgi:hypothetical protein